MLEARGVSYLAGGRPVVYDISLTVRPAQFLAITGPNGAGKSTLLRLLSGAIRPSRGEVQLAGRPLADYTPAELAGRRAFFEQRHDREFPFLVHEIVALGRQVHGLGARMRQRNEAAIQTAMIQTGIAHLAHRRFDTLSGGEAMRVHLARILAQETGVIFLDEPTNHLDLAHQAEILGLFKTLAREGRTIVAVLHDLNLASLHGDEIIVLDGGKLAARGAPKDVITTAMLRDVYGLDCALWSHPSGPPWVVPLHAVSASGTAISGT